jgi:2Fe-2S ferredoxin
MTTITFIDRDGETRQIEADTGRSLMQAAVDALIPGILADCGGYCSCATCHAYIELPAHRQLPEPSADEAMMLEGVMHLQDNSRLCCQIEVDASLDGMVVRIPPA